MKKLRTQPAAIASRFVLLILPVPGHGWDQLMTTNRLN